MIKRIAVFCGSSVGRDDAFKASAALLGQTLAKQNIELVYGGARIGLMGALAEGALGEGGRVIGVLPKFLRSKEVAHEGLTQLILVDSMHERKTKMNELSDGVIALPGGFGTLDELFEILTWGQLGLHEKPVGILNVGGYYDSLIDLVQTMVDKGLLKEMNQGMLLVGKSIDELLEQMRSYVAPVVGKWIDEEDL